MKQLLGKVLFAIWPIFIIVIILLIITSTSCGKVNTVTEIQTEIQKEGYVKVGWIKYNTVYYHNADVETFNPDTAANAVMVYGILINSETLYDGYISYTPGTFETWRETNIKFGR